MSSEILPGDQQKAAPAFWRTVATVRMDGWNTRDEQAAQALDQARREGYERGLAAGRKEVEVQVTPVMEKLAGTLAELAALRDKLREDTLHDLVRLATMVASRVIHREVVIDPDALGGLVKAAFAKLQAREVSRVRLHPSLEPLVRRCMEQNGAPKNLVLMADPALSAGTLLFETSQGVLDASVETQLHEIERGLIDRLEM